MDELHMVREGNHLVPVDEMSAEELARLPLRTQVLVKVTQPRNLRQHRLAWALATKIAEACDWLHDQDDAMAWLKIKARHVRYIHDHANGETQIIPKSIRFAALDQMGFDRIFKRMVYVTVTEIIPGLDEAALRAEIESMVGIDPGSPTDAKLASEPKPRGRPRKPRATTPAAVSVIPPHDPITGEVIDDFPGDRPMTETPKAGGTIPSAPPPASSAPPSPLVAAQHGGPAAQAPIPKNAVQWEIYAHAWIAAYLADPEKSDQDMMIRWNNERALRNDCGLTSDQRQPVFEVYCAALDQKRKKL